MMRTVMIAAAMTLAGLTAAAPASAEIRTFANYSGVGGANMYWQRTGTTFSSVGTPAQVAASRASALATAGGHFFTVSAPTSTTPGAVQTEFTFLDPNLFGLGALAASFRFDATATAGSPAQRAGSFVYEPIVSGTFSFTYTGTIDLKRGGTVYRTGANLLSASFRGGTIAGQIGATSGSSTASSAVAGETIAYTSDVLDFSHTVEQDFALSLSSITRGLTALPNQALRSFAATTTGSFSTDPAPVGSATPEPATWAMLIVGFGFVGVSRRRQVAAA